MENTLIKVTIKNDQQLVSARDLHKGLNIKKRFSAWVNQNFKDFDNGTDFMGVPSGTSIKNGNGRIQYLDDYSLTLDMAKQLCMMSHTELGKKYRRYFIELERKWNDPQEVVKRGYEILQNENTQLKLENNRLVMENVAQSELIEHNQPKVVFADAVSVSDTPILIGELAKILKQNGVETLEVDGKTLAMGPNNLFKWMRANNYLISRKGTDYNSPTARAMNMGLFRIKESTHVSGDGVVKITKTPKVTGKGQQYFINKFLRKGVINHEWDWRIGVRSFVRIGDYIATYKPGGSSDGGHRAAC